MQIAIYHYFHSQTLHYEASLNVLTHLYDLRSGPMNRGGVFAKPEVPPLLAQNVLTRGLQQVASYVVVHLPNISLMESKANW